MACPCRSSLLIGSTDSMIIIIVGGECQSACKFPRKRCSNPAVECSAKRKRCEIRDSTATEERDHPTEEC